MAVGGAPWRLECEKMEQRNNYLLTSGQWSDCSFMVGPETNQELIQAHKLLLAMATPVFEAMFYGGLSERDNPVVPTPDIQPDAFRALLQYIYTCKINISSFEMAWEILYGAKKYMLIHLEKECIRYINSVLGPGNVCQAYEFACHFDNKTLMDKCIAIISTNTKEVLKDRSFMDVELKTLITVCSLDYLNLDSELDLFHAVARYAEAEQRRQGPISPPVDEEPSKELSDKLLLLSVESSSQKSSAAELDSKSPAEVVTSEPTTDKENLKEEEPSIRKALQKIRFLSMSAQEFAEGPALSDLLKRGESFAVLMNIVSRVGAVAMPIGFSESRRCRRPQIMSQYLKGRVDRIIVVLKSGDTEQVAEAAWAARNIMRQSYEIQSALDKGLLAALVPALSEGDPACEHNAVQAITYFTYSATATQLCVLPASGALLPYCRLLAGFGNTCFRVMCGLTTLLKEIEESSKRALILKLREFGVPELLIPVQQEGDAIYRGAANDLLAYFSNK